MVKWSARSDAPCRMYPDVSRTLIPGRHRRASRASSAPLSRFASQSHSRVRIASLPPFKFIGRLRRQNAQPSVFAGSAGTQQRATEAHPARSRIHIALVGRRIVGLDLQQYEGRAVALAQQPRAVGDLGLVLDSPSALDAGAGCDPFEIDAEAGVALD